MVDNDLISKSALFKAWDALYETQDANLLIDAMIKAAQDVPAVDAVEVVRCVNCVWYCEWRTKSGVFLCGRPNNGGLVVKPDFFCKHGKRKEVENGKSN